MAVYFVQRRFSSQFQKMCYNLSGFNRYGLRRDDMMDETDPDVLLAVERLPWKVRNERTYRILRAIQCDINKTILPRNQWTKYEEDEPYLFPIYEEIMRNKKEEEEWDKNH